MTNEEAIEALQRIRPAQAYSDSPVYLKHKEALDFAVAALREVEQSRAAVEALDALCKRVSNGEGDLVIRAASDGFMVSLDGGSGYLLDVLARGHLTIQAAVLAAAKQGSER